MIEQSVEIVHVPKIFQLKHVKQQSVEQLVVHVPSIVNQHPHHRTLEPVQVPKATVQERFVQQTTVQEVKYAFVRWYFKYFKYAFVHWYVGNGVEEGELAEARDDPV
eukprot:2196926-Alexandrium_andersonii.AAC.1